MPFYKANTLALNNAGFEGTWNYSGDILTYITPADRTGSLQVELASRYSDGSAIIDIDGSTVPSYSDTISVAAGSTVTVVPTITGSSATGVEVMYNPTESLTTVVDPDATARFVVPAGLSGSYDANTTWEPFVNIDPSSTTPAFYRPTRNELDAAIAANSGSASKGSTLLNATLDEGQTLSNALIYGGTTIEQLGGSWSPVSSVTSVGDNPVQVYVAELAPDESDGTPYGVDLIRTDIDQLFIPMDSEITNNDNAPPIMQVLPNVLSDRRVFTIAVDRNTVMKFSSNTAQEDNYAQIVTTDGSTDGSTTYGGFDSEGDPLPDEYTTPDGNVKEIRLLTPAALNASRDVTSFTSNPVKDELEQNLTSEQLLGNDYFTINQHCGPNINASRTYRYDPGESGGADELQYDGILRAMEWDHGTKAYVDGEGGSYYQYISGAVSGNPEKLNNNEWCLIHKPDGRTFIYYAPDYGDSVSTPATKATFMFPVLSKGLRVGANSTIDNCEIACFGKYADTSEGAITTVGSFVTVQNTDVICTATGLRGDFKLVDRCNLIWSSKRNAACTNIWDSNNTTGFHTIIRDSTFRFAQIQSGLSMLNGGVLGPSRESPPLLIQGNIFCTPVTCHGQGMSLYKSAYQNATVKENAFLDFVRAMSFQDVSDRTNSFWETSLGNYTVRNFSWIPSLDGVQTPEYWKSDSLVKPVAEQDMGDDWNVVDIFYDASGTGEITLAFADTPSAIAFRDGANPVLKAQATSSSQDYDITFATGTREGNNVVYRESTTEDDSGGSMGNWPGTFSQLLLSNHFNFMTNVASPVRTDNSSSDWMRSNDMVGLKVINNVLYQGTVFSPPESGQSFISHNASDMLLSNDDDVYPGRWTMESNSIAHDPAIYTDPASPASVDTGYNYNIIYTAVSNRVNSFGHRVVLRNNILPFKNASLVDEPNDITGYTGDPDTDPLAATQPVGCYSAYNGGLSFQSFFTDRFPNNSVSGRANGVNDLPDVSLEKYTSVFSPATMTVSGQWADGASDGGKLGVRWQGGDFSYASLRAQKSNWWNSLGLSTAALAAPYVDTVGQRRNASNIPSDYVVLGEDERAAEITSVDVIFNPNTTSFTDETIPVSSTISKEASTTVSYEWSLKRAGGGEVLFGATVTPTGDGSTAEVYTGSFTDTDTEMDDLQVVLKATTTNGNYAGWTSVSDTTPTFLVSDSPAPAPGDFSGEFDGLSGTGGAVDSNPTTVIFNAYQVILKGTDAGSNGLGFTIYFPIGTSDRDDFIAAFPTGYTVVVEFDLNDGSGLQTATYTSGGWNPFSNVAKSLGGTWTGLPVDFWPGGGAAPGIYSMTFSNP